MNNMNPKEPLHIDTDTSTPEKVITSGQLTVRVIGGTVSIYNNENISSDAARVPLSDLIDLAHKIAVEGDLDGWVE